MSAPILFHWDGEAMWPLKRSQAAADDAYTVGEVYRMEVVAERSLASHRHYFAAIHDAWMNMPDEQALEFANSDHLRKHALIMTGFREERKLVCETKEEARKVAAFIRPLHDYAIVSVSDNVVVEWTARSQAMAAMGKKTFQESKQAVLDFLDAMLGVAPGETAKNAGVAA